MAQGARRSRGKVALAAFLLVLAAGWTMNRVRLYHRAQQLLPSAIETSGLQRFAMTPGQLQCLGPVDGHDPVDEPQGNGVFRQFRDVEGGGRNGSSHIRC